MEDPNERFIRWQGNLIAQSSSVNNLLTTIGIGITGGIIIMFNNDFHPPCYIKVLFLVGIMFCAFSCFFGIAGSISRLFDFRFTLKKIKNERDKHSAADLQQIKDLYTMYGKLTWFFSTAQIICFGIGLISLWIAFFITYSDRIL